jgi:hypothetical protein
MGDCMGADRLLYRAATFIPDSHARALLIAGVFCQRLGSVPIWADADAMRGIKHGNVDKNQSN